MLEEQVRGLLRVVELFEARKPKGQAIVTEVGGGSSTIETKGCGTWSDPHAESWTRRRSDSSAKSAPRTSWTASGDVPLVKAGRADHGQDVQADQGCRLKTVMLRKSSWSPTAATWKWRPGTQIRAGRPADGRPAGPAEGAGAAGPARRAGLPGPRDPEVYKSQGVDINDKHVEVIVRQMLKKRKIRHPGDSALPAGPDRGQVRVRGREHRACANAGGDEATADWVLLGITEASLADGELPLGGLLPEDHARSDGGGSPRQEGRPGRPEGERHHRAAHPGRHGSAALPQPGRGGADGERRVQEVKPLPRQMSLQDVDVTEREELSPLDLRAIASPEALPGVLDDDTSPVGGTNDEVGGCPGRPGLRRHRRRRQPRGRQRR